MSKINQLSSAVYNRIAAGEVVERPYSVVKELVENSIDSGAKNVTIEIEHGGTTFIRVTDDGSGIEKSELKKALLPHATSKISKASDLDNIVTLGFRGEALASIASVSKITIISKPQNQENGASIHAEGGVMEDVTDCAAANGTVITVNNLFFNTPAREKFLKTPKGEESDISAYIARFILGNLDVAFKFVADGKTVYQSYGDGLESAMACVYGAGILENCYYINTEKHGIGIRGYVGKPFYSKPNRTYQTFFLNGRYIVNQTVASAIGNAYASYLMKRQYPFYVLTVSVPTETVDVNVHPNKTDVRFSNNSVIYGSLYSVVSKVLDGSSEALNIVVEKPSVDIPKTQKEANEIIQEYVKHNPKTEEVASRKFDDDFRKVTFADSGFSSNNYSFQNKLEETKKTEPTDIFQENKAYLESLERKKAEKFSFIDPLFDENKEVAKPIQNEIEIKRTLKYIGQVLNTYLVLEDGINVYFADQHAAHERLLFDKFKEQMDNNSVDTQPLLVPYVLDCNYNEHAFLSEKKDTLNEMGIEIEDFGGNSFKISAVPVCISEINIGNFFAELLSDLNELRSVTMQGLLKDRIAKKACKAAIKSGDVLREQEIDVLVDALNNNLGLKCPHGRPVAVKITRTEIDKWFKRIL